jgi:hypothetical protein
MEIKSAFKKFGLRYYSTLVCSEKCSACNDILKRKRKNNCFFFHELILSGGGDSVLKSYVRLKPAPKLSKIQFKTYIN